MVGRGLTLKGKYVNLYKLLAARSEAGNPVSVGVVGAGKFGTMFLSQAKKPVGIHVLVSADLDVERAHDACARAGWPKEQTDASSFSDATRNKTTFITDNSDSII